MKFAATLHEGEGLTRSAALRTLVENATPLGSSPPLDRDGVLAVLAKQARGGSTSAARLLLADADARAQLERVRKLTTD